MRFMELLRGLNISHCRHAEQPHFLSAAANFTVVHSQAEIRRSAKDYQRIIATACDANKQFV
jgi:hypothetical protein